MFQTTHCCNVTLGILYNAFEQASAMSMTQFATFKLNELVLGSLFSSPGTVGGGRSVLSAPWDRPASRVDRLDIPAVLTVALHNQYVFEDQQKYYILRSPLIISR